MDDLKQQWQGYVSQSQLASTQADTAYQQLLASPQPTDSTELEAHTKLLDRAMVRSTVAKRLLETAQEQLALIEEASPYL